MDGLDRQMGAVIATPVFEGVLDAASWDLIGGWAWYSDDPARRVVLEVFVDDVLITTIAADKPRLDIAAAGKGDGRCGFAFALSPLMFHTPRTTLAIRDRTTGIAVAGTPAILENPEAGLDTPTQAFIARRIAAAGPSMPIEALDQQTSFILTILDRLVEARQQAETARDQTQRGWRQMLDGRPVGKAIAGLLEFAAAEYGDTPLEIPCSPTPEVSIVIPVHDQFVYTYACLQKIVDHTPGHRIEVILVDDQSTDETMAASLILSGARILRNERRLGFVGSVMAGAAIARGRYLMLLHNDTEVQAGWLDHLLATCAQDPSIAVVGARLLFPSGRLQECGGIVWRFGDTHHYGRDQDPNRSEFRHLRDADTVSDAALLVRRDVWDRVGGFSPEFAPCYYEDVDLCFKVREAGYRVVIQPQAQVAHHEGVSAGADRLTGMKRHQRAHMARFAQRWADTLQHHAVSANADLDAQATRAVTRRALFIDDVVPQRDRNAGSNAAFAHMHALARLGYQVHFVASADMASTPPYTEALEAIGVRCHAAPYHRSLEEVLRTYFDQFDLVYLHRVSNARYIGLARACNAGARIVYSVADLHHLRLEREAALTHDHATRRAAARFRTEELAAAQAADCTLVHSPVEAALLAAAMPSAQIAVIPWAVRPDPVTTPLTRRAGIAFIGSDHPPNIDAVEWLLTDIMPLVWATDPAITLHLLGDHVDTPPIQALLKRLALPSGAGSRVHPVGRVPDLPSALADVRLTIAPLRYGAGLKGKVIDSMALGLPCVMTPCAAEGIALPGRLAGLVAGTAAEIAGLIIRYHTDEAANQAAARAGLEQVTTAYAATTIDALLEAAIRPPEAPVAKPARRRKEAPDEGRPATPARSIRRGDPP